MANDYCRRPSNAEMTSSPATMCRSATFQCGPVPDEASTDSLRPPSPAPPPVPRPVKSQSSSPLSVFRNDTVFPGEHPPKRRCTSVQTAPVLTALTLLADNRPPSRSNSRRSTTDCSPSRRAVVIQSASIGSGRAAATEPCLTVDVPATANDCQVALKVQGRPSSASSKWGKLRHTLKATTILSAAAGGNRNRTEVADESIEKNKYRQHHHRHSHRRL